jgi:hypothetical protein
MTQFTNFIDDFSKQNITLFADFISDALPFSFNKSTVSGTGTVTNSTAAACGVASLGLQATTSAGLFFYTGIYMASAVADGVAVDKTYRLGTGMVDVTARCSASQSVATHIHVVGISSIDRDTNARPGLDFVGFFSLGGDSAWSVAVINNGSVVSFPTTQLKGTTAILRTVVNKNADSAEFYINGSLIRKIDTPMRTTVGMVPCIEIKDITSGGSATTGAMTADYFMVQQQVAR